MPVVSTDAVSAGLAVVVVSFLCTLVVVVVILSVVLGAPVVLTLPPLELENPVCVAVEGEMALLLGV